MLRITTILTLALALLATSCGGGSEIDTVNVDPTNAEAAETVLTEPVGAPTIDCSTFEGRWVGTETLGSPDDEGGVYTPVLTLSMDGESTLAESDTIEVFESYGCTITGIEVTNGETREIAKFINENSLQMGQATLTRDGS